MKIYISLFILWLVSFGVCIYMQYFFDVVRRSKVQEQNISCKCALNFDQWKTFSENYKPMRVWLRLIYKFMDNYCHFTTFLRVHSNSKEVFYLSWQNRYPNLKTTCHMKLKIFLWTKLLERLLLAKYLTSVTAALRTLEKKILFLSLPYPEEISLQTCIKLRKSLKELLNCF